MSTNAYRAAGVDLQAANSLKESIKAFATLSHGPQVLGGLGSFAGLYRLQGASAYKNPVLAASTDGVGTKLRIAVLMNHYESIGMDLVNLSVDDIITCGAVPLFFLDYISMGRLDPQLVEPLMRGMVWACREAGCALLGGETAQSPGVYTGDNLDLAGTIVGVVEEDAVLGPSKVREGDVLLGLASSGLHTNGFSLIRKVFGIDDDPSILHRPYDELGHTLGEELLVPHRSYYPLLEPHFPRINAMAHISGGGLAGNIPRVLPDGLAARIRKGAWEPQPIFPLIQRVGDVDAAEMYRVFNMGMGMVLICNPEDWGHLQRALPEAVVIGEVTKQSGLEQVTFIPS
jgi:phosphoribosylformylglycinamidine cyclo-ligase